MLSLQMSPKVDSSRASEPARSAWSRDVRPNTSGAGVTYSRRSYYYDREFSDSIIPPAGEFQIRPAPTRLVDKFQVRGGGKARGRQLQSIAAVAVNKNPVEVRAYEDDPFTRGRILQSAASRPESDDEGNGGGDIRNRASAAGIEMQDCVCVKPATTQAQSQAQLPFQTRNALTDSEEGVSGLTIAGLDTQTMAQSFVVAMDLAARMTEMYQRFRDSEARGGRNDEGLPDPYHLETGLLLLPPRYRSPSRASSSSSSRNSLRKGISQRPMISSASTSSSLGSNEPQGQGQGQVVDDENATATAQIDSFLAKPVPPLKRLCYYLVATTLLGVLASFGFALWWARSRGDVSAGFTIAGYLVAVDALVVAVVGIVHRPGCRCWKA